MGRRKESEMGWPSDWAFCICDFETTGIDTKKDFPIEVGCIFTDSRFVMIHSFECLLTCPTVRNMLEVGGSGDPLSWPTEWKPAFRVHGIKAKKLAEDGAAFSTAAISILEIIEALKSRGFRRIILLSDNAQFEYRFMRRLFKGQKWPFHYCAWDSSILLEGSGVGDPIPIHRALPDAAILHHALIRACERVGFFGG